MKGLDYLYLGLLMVASYLFANINFAKIISHCKHKDITKEGSGNPGTLNMLRTFGFFWAMINMTLEILKGVIPSLVGYLLFGEIGLYSCGVSAVVGHIFPIVFKFKGGKGVACTCGMFFVANWWVTLIVMACCFLFVTITSLGSVGTLGFVLIMSIIELCLVSPSNWICYVLIGFNLALIFFVHRKNIARLIHGKENPTNVRGAIKKDMAKLKSHNNENTKDDVADNNMSESNSESVVNEEKVDSNDNDAK